MPEAQEPFDYALPRRKWTLTKEAFDRLLAAFDTDADEAGEKYLLMRRNLVRYFEGRGCPFAEDHADEAVNRVARKLAEGEDILDLNRYSYGVARLLLLEIFKEREKEARALSELPSLRLVDSDHDVLDEGQVRVECLNLCVENLPRGGKQLILAYYRGDNRSRIENRKRLGRELGIPNQALRSRAVRLREKLEACLTTCCRNKRVTTTQIQGFSH